VYIVHAYNLAIVDCLAKSQDWHAISKFDVYMLQQNFELLTSLQTI